MTLIFPVFHQNTESRSTEKNVEKYNMKELCISKNACHQIPSAQMKNITDINFLSGVCQVSEMTHTQTLFSVCYVCGML